MLDDQTVNYINTFDRLALAVSGGRDSMALLDWFCRNVSKDRFFVVTVHHNLRGDEGKRDRDFVAKYCLDNAVECKVFDEDIPAFCQKGGYTVEQGARIRRRQIFESITDSKQANRVVTAHHAQDQVESILMHIFRGCGIRGLRGMVLDDGVLLRPMLKLSREQIEGYIKDNAVIYVDDSSNDSLDYTRNKLRLKILPLIRKAYGGADGNILRLSDRATEAFNFIDKSCHSFVVNSRGEVFISVGVLQSDVVIATNTIINAVDKAGTRVDLTQKHIDSILSLLTKGNGASVNLPFSLTAHRQGGYIVLSRYKNAQYGGVVDGYGEYDLGNMILKISEDGTGRLRCDFDKLLGCEIRNRQSGDVFKRYKGANKNLGDYLTDVKVPLRYRDDLIVLAKGKKVYALPQYDIADIIKVDENTKRVAYLSITNK